MALKHYQALLKYNFNFGTVYNVNSLVIIANVLIFGEVNWYKKYYYLN